MSKIEIPSKIRAENFGKDDVEVASKIGAIYNQFVDQIYFLLQKNIDFENLNRQIVTVTVTLNSLGKIVNPPTIKYSLNTKVQAVYCGNAVCLTNNLLFPTSAPFVSWQLNNNTLIITNVSGLQANSQYSLTLELVG